MKKPSSLVRACLPSAPKCLVSYLEHVGDLTYEEAPNYALLRQLFIKELTSMKCDDKSDVLDWVLSKPKAAKVTCNLICAYFHVIFLILASHS